MTRAFLGLGSNVGDRRRYLREAVETLGDAGIGLRAVSPLYETEPVGGPDQGRYLNLVVELDTELTARELLGVCRRIESAAGRVRGERWGPRTLDVDVLWVDGVELDEPDLTVPHPRMSGASSSHPCVTWPPTWSTPKPSATPRATSTTSAPFEIETGRRSWTALLSQSRVGQMLFVA
jgi:2-amino-4-hydroxy-6-hydroxymethyldihydropteridine diphosphokinase